VISACSPQSEKAHRQQLEITAKSESENATLLMDQLQQMQVQLNATQEELRFPAPSWLKSCGSQHGDIGRRPTMSTPHHQLPLMDRLMFVPKEKVIVCGIEKNAITLANHLVSALNNKKMKWFQASPGALGLSQETVHKRLDDPSWKKLVLYRDPVERFLSAYNSKCLRGDKDGPRHCEQALNLKTSEVSHLNAALSLYKSFPMDAHWRPQHYLCDGSVGSRGASEGARIAGSVELRG